MGEREERESRRGESQGEREEKSNNSRKDTSANSFTRHCTLWRKRQNHSKQDLPLKVAPCFRIKSDGIMGRLPKSSRLATSAVEGCKERGGLWERRDR